jgi:hypothetical protein
LLSAAGMTPALPDGCVIALLGAAGSGKTALAEALLERLVARGLAAARVVELPSSPFDVEALAALAAGGGAAITLLMGLDLPCQPGETAQRERTDALLRGALGAAGIPYTVIHGHGPERLAAAWNALLARADAAAGESAAAGARAAARNGSWPCDKCSDPACEHRLFSELLTQRGTP